MKPISNNPLGNDSLLPVDIVLGPSWWHRHEGITFDEDFFYHPARRVEVERRMEKVLYDRWGRHDLGTDRDKDLPCVGAVHLAAGYLVSQMLGCRIEYADNEPPQVLPADVESLEISPDAAFSSPAYKRLDGMLEALKTKHGYLCGDINWGGVLNVALDLRGQRLFMDIMDTPDEAARFMGDIYEVIRRFTDDLTRRTGTTSISVNRIASHFQEPLVLHSECSHTMISVADYERYLMPFDVQWSRDKRPYGIHYCGTDPHRFAETFAKLPHLDFLDVGWGGDVAKLREHLPDTFLCIRYSPVEITQQTPDEIRATLRRLIEESANPRLTGVCCINMDDTVTDEQVGAIFETVEQLREEYAGS
ncbi:MAG: hypothetical protein JXM70_06605 [Pirellulales bacterium]|nr:hypothetical protein [Pirellulales bacterium]